MIIKDLTLKEINKLDKNSKIYNFICRKEKNDKNFKFIYVIVNNNEIVHAIFERIFVFKEKFYVGFRVLKVLKKNKNSKLRKSDLLQFNEQNFPNIELLYDDKEYILKKDSSYVNNVNFEMSTNYGLQYNNEDKVLTMHIFFTIGFKIKKFQYPAKMIWI